LSMIEKMDKLNSCNFSGLLNRNLSVKETIKKKSSVISSAFLQGDSQHELMSYICHHREWGKFFKLKRMCFNFEPYLLLTTLEEFKAEAQNVIGQHLVNNIHIRQLDGDARHPERLEEI
jgi:hypothetical protein